MFYLPSSFSSLISAFLISVSSVPRLLRLVPCSCLSLFRDLKSKVFSSSKALNLLFKAFNDAKHFANTANWATTTTLKTSKSTFVTKDERCLLVSASLPFFSVVLAIKIRFYFLSIFDNLPLQLNSVKWQENNTFHYILLIIWIIPGTVA